MEDVTSALEGLAVVMVIEPSLTDWPEAQQTQRY